MEFLEPVICEGDVVFIHVLGTKKVVGKFLWKEGEGTDAFLKRHCFDAGENGYDVITIHSEFDPENFKDCLNDLLEIEFRFYKVHDCDNNKWFLVSLTKISWCQIDECFLIPMHPYNIIELCRHFSCLDSNKMTTGG